MKEQIKAIVAGLSAGIASLAVAVPDGITLAEGLTALGVAVATYGATYLAPRNEYKDEAENGL